MLLAYRALFLTAIAAVLPACSSVEFHLKHTSPNGATTDIHVVGANREWKVSVDPSAGDVCFTIIFTGPNGEEVGRTTGTADGGEGKLPPDATSYTTIVHACGSPPPAGAPAGPPWLGIPEVLSPYGSKSYSISHSSMDPSVGTGLATSYAVDAVDAAAALLAANQLDTSGPGSIVGNNITVQVHVSYAETVDGLVVVSSLPGRFAEFTIAQDGTVLADLKTGLNVTVSPAGNGWLSLTTLLPWSVQQPGSNTVLTQRGVSAMDASTTTLAF